MSSDGVAGARVHTTTDSPLGPLTLVMEPEGELAGVYLPDHRPAPPTDGFGEAVPAGDPRAAPAVAAVLAYLGGSARSVEVPLARPAGTAFQQRVWAEVAAVPYGSTRTYGELSAAVGHPSAHRAVGAAIARNPLCLAVPCHRVLARGGAVTGYAGGVEAKRWLLALEARVVAQDASATGTTAAEQAQGSPAGGAEVLSAPAG